MSDSEDLKYALEHWVFKSSQGILMDTPDCKLSPWL